MTQYWYDLASTNRITVLVHFSANLTNVGLFPNQSCVGVDTLLNQSHVGVDTLLNQSRTRIMAMKYSSLSCKQVGVVGAWLPRDDWAANRELGKK